MTKQDEPNLTSAQRDHLWQRLAREGWDLDRIAQHAGVVRERVRHGIVHADACERGDVARPAGDVMGEYHGYVVVLFGNKADGWCTLSQCPVGIAEWFPTSEAAHAYSDTLSVGFQPHVLMVKRTGTTADQGEVER